MRKYISILLVLPLLPFVMASCSDDPNLDYESGKPTPEGCMAVFIDASNPGEYILEPGEATSISISLSRLDSTQAAEVPLVCTSADASLTLPAKATFAAGEAHTTVDVTFGSLETKHKYAFTIAVDDAYADHYAATPGSTYYSSYIMAAAWEVVSDDVTMTWTTAGIEHTFKTRLERLGNLDRYRLPDFLGSGLDMIFTAGKKSNYSEGFYKIEPYTHYLDWNDGTVDTFEFYDERTENYATWTVNGVTVTYMCMMRSYAGTDYSYISFADRFGMFGTYYSEYIDGQYDYWNYVRFTW